MGITISTITTKGQITIPKDIRDALDLKPQDQVGFVLEEGRALLIPMHRRSLSALRGALQATRPYPGTTEMRETVAMERGTELLYEVKKPC